MNRELDPTTRKDTAAQVGKILDALATLSCDSECHVDVPAETLVFSAARVPETCVACTTRSAALKKIWLITEQHGGGCIPSDRLQRIDGASPD